MPDINIFGSDASEVSLSLSEPINVPVFSDTADFSLKYKIKNYDFAPINKGDILGSVCVLSDGKPIKTVSVIAAKSVNQTTEISKNEYLIVL